MSVPTKMTNYYVSFNICKCTQYNWSTD